MQKINKILSMLGSDDEAVNKLKTMALSAPQACQDALNTILIKNAKLRDAVADLESELQKTNNGFLAITVELDEELERRKKAETELNEYKENLEELIEQRTERLMETNMQLKKEIKQRKSIENKLRKSETLFRLLTENSVDIIWQMDINLKFTYVSPALSQITGFACNDWIGTSLWDHTENNNDIVIISLAFDNLINNNKDEFIRFELNLLCQDSLIKPVEIICRPIYNKENIITGFIGSTRDISEQRKAEDQILLLNEELENKVETRTIELQQANKDLESFSYSVSHDLRAPLRHIEGFSHLLRKNLVDLDNKSLRYLNLISDSTDYMGSLIDKLLEFSRYGRNNLNLSNVNMKKIVEIILVNYSKEISQGKYIIRVSDLPDVTADYQLIYQVWQNYISNAIKYSSQKKHPIIEIDFEENGKEFIYYIRDNGTGFDEKYSDKLFGVFQRLHSEREYKGTGIGLANVKRIILKHGGRVWGMGKKGAGATFYFSLPKLRGEL